MNSVAPTRTSNNADGTPCPNTNLELAPDELDANIAEVINNVGLQVNGFINNTGSLALAEDETHEPAIGRSVTTTDKSNNPSPNLDNRIANFPDGGLDDSLIAELGILTDPPSAVHLQPEGNANLLHAMTTLESFFTNNKGTNAQTVANNNMFALLGSMVPGAQSLSTAPSVNVNQPSTSPLDDLEKVAGITSGEGEELDKYEDPMKTLKSRFPTLDPILRGSLEELGTALQKQTEEVEKRKASYAIFLVPTGANAYVVESIEVKNDLKIPHLCRDGPGYLQAKSDLDQEIITYKTRSSACYKKAAKAGVACVIRARIGCFVQLTSSVAKYIVRSLCTGNTKIRRDIWHVPIKRRTLACIISLLDEQQINNKTFFSDYLETSNSDVITAFLDTYKESTHTQRTSTINTFVPTAENMHHMSSNALEYKSLVKERTKYIYRLVVSYTHGARQIFDKVQKRRAEIQRLRSQMQAKKRASATAATVKAVDLTEREEENGNHMNMKIMQIVDDRVNSRTANSVTFAAKKEARKVATEQVDR
jgi:hypothetical protein